MLPFSELTNDQLIKLHENNKTKNENKDYNTFCNSQKIVFVIKETIRKQNNLSPLLIDDMFQVHKINYNLRYFQKFANAKKNSVKMGLGTITYRAPQLWNLVSTEIKDAPSLSIFKEKIKSWYCDNCLCRLCKTYIANVDFI